MNFQLRVQHALTDIEDMDFLMKICPEANGIEQVTSAILTILSVQGVAFRPRITINEMGKWKALRDLHNSRLQIFLPICSQSMRLRRFRDGAFRASLSLLFVNQVQPVDPRLACCLVHATAAINEKVIKALSSL
jgi:hypothetical protein